MFSVVSQVPNGMSHSFVEIPKPALIILYSMLKIVSLSLLSLEYSEQLSTFMIVDKMMSHMIALQVPEVGSSFRWAVMKIVVCQIIHDVADECASQQPSALVHWHGKNVSKWDVYYQCYQSSGDWRKHKSHSIKRNLMCVCIVYWINIITCIPFSLNRAYIL